jgi:hypothetical protein
VIGIGDFRDANECATNVPTFPSPRIWIRPDKRPFAIFRDISSTSCIQVIPIEKSRAVGQRGKKIRAGKHFSDAGIETSPIRSSGWLDSLSNTLEIESGIPAKEIQIS